ncbi:21 kDa seed protein-like [Telopea speciosissima]|uniref:21 kDa seed protein-like n=1 Tax=Telopea speciosissima TaxID=54955 RepID=UPI001CC4507B|nr:21 kDa seed protein-like [Telopea speciosissima]
MQSRFMISSVLLVLALALQSQAISWSHSHNNAVLDTDGNELQAGQAYYLVSAARAGNGGGVALDRRQSSQSSMVKQHSSNTNFGSPVSFSPASNSHDDMIIQRGSTFESAIKKMFFGNTPSPSHERTINEATDVNIRFSEMPVVWQVQESHNSPSSKSQMRYVTIGGQPGHPGSSTVRNWFKIKQISRSNSSPEYIIAYCPSVCESCHVECGNIGIMEENGKRWLTLSQNTEFPFMFVKAIRS